MQTPEEVLLSFMTDMNHWEANCRISSDKVTAKEVDYYDHKKMCEDSYKQLFDKHCSKLKGTPRGVCFKTPPEYNPAWENIKKVKQRSSTLVNIETLKSYPAEYNRDEIHYVYIPDVGRRSLEAIR